MFSRKDPIYVAVDNLCKACGFDNQGESGTERFYHLLSEAVDQSGDELDESHEEGLCLDMVSALASNLETLLANRN